MRYRKLSATGDYTFGQGGANFWNNQAAGVAQSVVTRLRLLEGEWYLDTTEGTPYEQSVLGYNTQSSRDLAIRTRILTTLDVTALDDYTSAVDPVTRRFTVSGSIFTAFSKQSIPFGPVIL